MSFVLHMHDMEGVRNRTTDDLEEAYVKRAMVEASADVIALATVDKLRSGSAYLVAPVAELTGRSHKLAPVAMNCAARSTARISRSWSARAACRWRSPAACDPASRRRLPMRCFGARQRSWWSATTRTLRRSRVLTRAATATV